MIQIKLKDRIFALIDDENISIINNYQNWFLDSKGYAYTLKQINNRRKRISMARLIMSINNSKIQVDHINGNRLDNRKNNLRLCNSQQNNMNRKKSKNLSSKYKGIYYDKKRKCFISSIKISSKPYVLGRFYSESFAAKIYDRVALKLFGEYAKTNFPKEKYKILLSIKQARFISRTINSRNKSSKYKNIHFCNTHQRWVAKFELYNKKYCKYFLSEINAFNFIKSIKGKL